MPDPQPRYWKEARRDTALGDFVSISSPVTPHDTLTRAGDYLRVWRLDGVPFEAADPSRIAERHDALCNLLRNLPAGQTAVYQHRIQRHVVDRLTDPQEPPFCAAFSCTYQDRLAAEPMLSREIYLTLLYRPHPSKLARGLAKGARTLRSLEDTQRAALEFMAEKGALVERTLRGFGPRLLGLRAEGDRDYWEAGEFFAYLINGTWRKVVLPRAPGWKVLPNTRLVFGGAKLEIRELDRRRFAVMLDIKEYDGEVEPGTLGALLYEPAEFIETQSFAAMPRRQAIASLTLQRNQLLASEDVARTQIEAMDHALNELGEGSFQMGEYGYTLAVLGDTLEQASQRAANAIGAVAETTAMELVPVDLVADAAWFAQQPGNFRWRPRKAHLSSKAFAALACAHNFMSGKRDGNPWGEALALMRTPAGQPFYLNLHASPPDEDNEGQKLPGNTIFVGQTGSGKTTLLTALLALSRKWPVPPRIVSFSLHRDTEIVIRAMGGTFYTFGPNVPTGLNPLQRPATPERIAHWIALVKHCLHTPELPLLPDDETVIVKAVHTVAGMDPSLRWFSTLRQSLTRDGRNSLYDRFGRWCRGGEHGWVFDMAPDRLQDLDRHPAIGFDYTGIADAPAVKTPIMMELLHIMGGLVNGQPLIYHVAESWKALGDPLFAPFIKNGQKTIRKANGLGVFDTQEVADLVSNENGRTMIEQSVTKLILPNADATRADYVDGLGLTEAEFEIVRSLGATGTRRFLCKQGNDSVQCEFDLTGADDMLTVLSASVDNVELLDTIRAEVGDDPERWLPVLYQRVRERRTLRKAA